MNSRFQRLLLVGCWLGLLALGCFSIFRFDPGDSPQRSEPALVEPDATIPDQPAMGEPAHAPEAPAPRRTVRVPNQRIVWPMVLQEISGLSAAQEAAKNRVMEDFIEKVGGEDQDGSDPAYRGRWLALQPLADQQFRVLIGQEAFAAFEMQLAQAANSVSRRTE